MKTTISDHQAKASQALKLVIKPAVGTFSIADARQEWGWFNLCFYVMIGRRRLLLKRFRIIRSGDRHILVTGRLIRSVATRLVFEYLSRTRGWSVAPTLVNRGNGPFSFCGYGFMVGEEVKGGGGQVMNCRSQYLWTGGHNEMVPHGAANGGGDWF